jgi:uracil-DNA glycosylase family 4
MPWTERQQAMLQAMGLRTWSGSADAAEGDEPAREARSAAEPVHAPEPVTARAPAPTLSPAAAATAAAAAATGADSPVARLDWPALRAAVADCRACTLCETRTQTVFGVGHPQAHWMIVGEAPGEQEDRLGEPFVGAAGQLLDSMLRAVGLGRSPGEVDDPARQVFIANVLKCRPPVNRNPRPEEVAQCAPFLKRQVALVQPRLILAMGRFAVQALLDTDAAIGKLRGQVHRYEGVPVVVTYHPAYLLRNLPDKARAWEDLCLAREVAAAPR